MGMEERAPKRLPVKKGLFPWPLPEGPAPSLTGSRCEQCGKTFFPKREQCPLCRDRGEVREVSLSRTGRLYTYTIVRQAPAGFHPPYATALVDLPEGVRLFAQLTTADPAEIVLDGPVELSFGTISTDKEGNEIVSYRFSPSPPSGPGAGPRPSGPGRKAQRENCGGRGEGHPEKRGRIS